MSITPRQLMREAANRFRAIADDLAAVPVWEADLWAPSMNALQHAVIALGILERALDDKAGEEGGVDG